MTLAIGIRLGPYDILAQIGAGGEALPACERSVALSRVPNIVAFLGNAYARMGRTDDAKALLRELEDRQRRGEYMPPFAPLCIHVGLGDVEGVRSALEACIADQTPPLSIQVSCGPWLDQFRGDPRIDRALDRLYDGARPR
jgi:hypothetical protein